MIKNSINKNFYTILTKKEIMTLIKSIGLITVTTLNISTTYSMYQNQRDFFGQSKVESQVQSDAHLKQFWVYTNNRTFTYPTPAQNAVLSLNLYLHVCASVFNLNIKQIETTTIEAIEELYQNQKLSSEEQYELSSNLIKQTVLKTNDYKNRILSAIENTCQSHFYWIRNCHNQQSFTFNQFQ